MIPRGYDSEKLIKVIWEGTGGMVMNSGDAPNEEAFWKIFFDRYPERNDEERKVFDEFYVINFDEAKDSCGFNPESGKTIKSLKDKGYDLILASNPIFPRIAQEKRMRWAGVDPNDFSYITTYENSCYCKPNPGYYREILQNMELKPEECLMVGNDVTEDMVAASLGMKVYLVTDWMINKEGKDISVYPHGSFEGLFEVL